MTQWLLEKTSCNVVKEIITPLYEVRCCICPATPDILKIIFADDQGALFALLRKKYGESDEDLVKRFEENFDSYLMQSIQWKKDSKQEKEGEMSCRMN